MLTESYVKGPELPITRDITIGQLLKEVAEEHPNRLALIAGVSELGNRRECSYGELYADSLIAARAMVERFAPGERVAIMAPNIFEWVVVELAAAMAGVVLVTVNPSYQPEEIAYVLKQSESVAIFVLAEYRGNQMLASVEKIREQCPSLREVIQLDHWDEFMATGMNSTALLPDVKSSDPVMIQYTSGTTGFPKGALLHHRGMLNNAAHMHERMGVKEGSVWLTTMPMFHTGGCGVCLLGTMAKKGTQVLVEAFEPGLVLELIETYKVCAMLGVPTMLIAMLEHADFVSRDLSSLAAICSGGSTVPASLVTRIEKELGVKFVIIFGQTECSPVASMTRPDDTTEDKANTVGGPMAGVEVKIIDTVSGDIAPLHTLGEYCVRGYNVMHGYFNMPEATDKTIDQDGWLHTGDLCTMDERGYCAVEGRLKDMIIRGGENIYPREIEDQLFQHPAVAEVAVLGLPDERFGEVVAAFIRVSNDVAVVGDDLHTYLREHLSPQKTPKHWFFIDQFPLTGSGKIQKFELRKQWQSGEFA